MEQFCQDKAIQAFFLKNAALKGCLDVVGCLSSIPVISEKLKGAKMSTSKRRFKAEVNKILDLVIHSLYSHKEIFLRELISNASDAIDKARYQSLTDESLHENGDEWKIKIIVDKDAGTLTVSDNGIGMTRDEAVESLGTIAHSGTKEFLKALENKNIKDNPELIGQFGVGFYSSFMVADEVTVTTRKAGEESSAGVKWESTADGSYTVEDFEKSSKGTDVVLKIKEEEKQYLDEWEIRSVVKKYSDFIDYPIVMDVERKVKSEIDPEQMVSKVEEEKLNSQKAIWLKDKSEISEDEYNEFYKHVSHDFSDPARVLHYKGEGVTEFSVLVYIPKKRPFDIFYKDYKVGPTLYVKRVQIMDHCENLVPPYLRFVKGVVDSSDLPLNVSREILQNNRTIEVIRKNITKKVLEALAAMKSEDPEAYSEFYEEFGRILKEGIHYDFERKEAIADLLLFESTETEEGKTTTLAEYVERMHVDQKEIYYITGPSKSAMASSPHLEAFKAKGLEVIFMTDEIDDMIITRLSQYKEKHFKSVIKGDIDFGGEEKQEEQKKSYEKLIEMIKDKLKDDISEVRISNRLTDSAVCLVAGEHDMDPQMRKMLESMGQTLEKQKRILEINPNHDLIANMNAMFEKDRSDPLLEEYIPMLLDQALLNEGGQPKNPVAFVKTVAKLMAAQTNRA